MRMHPRRRGAYNFSARAASAFTNAYFKNKKLKEKLKIQNKYYSNTQNNTNDNAIGCLTIVLFFALLVLFFVCGKIMFLINT